MPHRILAWTGRQAGDRLQEAAREARYRLLVGHARESGASHLVTAHTLDDQAETVLMRLSRGSGLAGLAGMRPERRPARASAMSRPLLGWPKAAPSSTCAAAQGWPFVDDPSNADERFARVRWRKLMPLLAEEGLTAERLARLAERAARAEEALDVKAQEALARAEPVSPRAGLSLRGAPSLPRSPSRSPCGCSTQALAAGRSRPGHRSPEAPRSLHRSACARPSGPGRRCA